MQPFVVMAKPVGARCNLQCSYCYYSKQTPGGVSAGGVCDIAPSTVMGGDILERFIRQYIEACPGQVVSFTWHGGEPTLAGPDFFRRAVELQKRYLPPGKSCWNNLQTNGILLDDEWCAFLADAGFDVGLSIDGVAQLHDKYRKDRGGLGSYERAAAAVKRLQGHGVRPDLLCTVTSATAGDCHSPDKAKSADAALSVYRALRELDTGWIQFIPIVRRGADGRVTDDSVTAEGYGEFLCAVFDEWSRNDLGKLDVQLFAETLRVWSGGTAGLCWMAPTCGRALIVELDGGVYSCDHFVDPGHRIGDIWETHLGELAELPEQLRFGENKRDLLPGSCRACPWIGVCNGGCPKDRFAHTADGEPGLNYLCAGLKRFFTHAKPTSDLIARLSKQGGTPKKIMGEISALQNAKWKNIGRNDPCPCGSGRKAKNCCWSKRP